MTDPITIQTIDSLSDAMQDALGMVAIGMDGMAQLMPGGTSALDRLERRGLVASYDENIYGSGKSPIDSTPARVRRYYVPIPVHITWCAWCSTKPTE
jgi:hypothetical protein